jgi:hypothetical protein
MLILQTSQRGPQHSCGIVQALHPSNGVLLCASKVDEVADYALSSMLSPDLIAEC